MSRSSLLFIFCLVLVAFGLSFNRLFQIQILDGAEYRARQLHQITERVVIPARRGLVYSRDRRLMAMNQECYSVAGSKWMDVSRVAPEALVILDLDRETLQRRLQDRTFAWLRRCVDLSDGELVRELTDLHVVKEGRRVYPYGELASAVIGFAGIDTQGLEGVEYYFDERLRGQSGEEFWYRSARRERIGPRLESPPARPAVHGTDVRLTIDLDLQRLLEEQLKSEVIGSAQAAGVVVDACSGEVLALAVRPGFDPNRFRDYSDSVLFGNPIVRGTTRSAVLSAFVLKVTEAESGGGVRSGPGSLIEGDGGERAEDPVTVGRRLGLGQKVLVGIAGGAIGDIRYVEKGLVVEAAPIQVATALSTVVNDGLRPQITLLREEDGTDVSGLCEGGERVIYSGAAQFVRRSLPSSSRQIAIADGADVRYLEWCDSNGPWETGGTTVAGIVRGPLGEVRLAVVLALEQQAPACDASRLVRSFEVLAYRLLRASELDAWRR